MIFTKINSLFLIENHGGQEVWDDIFKMLRETKSDI